MIFLTNDEWLGFSIFENIANVTNELIFTKEESPQDSQNTDIL